MNINFFLKKNRLKKESSTSELIERGFAPQNGKIDILLINPPSSITKRKRRVGKLKRETR